MEKFIKVDIILKKILKKYGITEDLEILYKLWEDIVGKDISEKIKIYGAKGDEILVSVESPAYYHHLKLHQNEYLKKINDYLNKTSENGFKKIKVLKSK